MKKIYIRTLALVLSWIFVYGTVSAQEEIRSMKQTLEITLDDLGNADIDVIMKLNASQWDIFKRTIGANPSQLKREMIKAMPAFYLTDFKYEEEPMDRTYTFSMKAFAAAQQDQKGKWKSGLDMKDPDIIKLNDHQFRLNLNMNVNGQILEQTQLINLPKQAKSGKIEKDSFGNAVLTYNMSGGLIDHILKIVGVLFLLAGAGMIVLNKRKKILA